jgi:hypothetical protein
MTRLGCLQSTSVENESLAFRRGLLNHRRSRPRPGRQSLGGAVCGAVIASGGGPRSGDVRGRRLCAGCRGCAGRGCRRGAPPGLILRPYCAKGRKFSVARADCPDLGRCAFADARRDLLPGRSFVRYLYTHFGQQATSNRADWPPTCLPTATWVPPAIKP